MKKRPGHVVVPIVYPYVAHYRKPVFAELVARGAAEGIRYVVAADATARVRSLKVVDPSVFASNGSASVGLRNVWLPSGVLWQCGLISYLWRTQPDAIVFLGDAHFVSTWVACGVAKIRGSKVLMWTQGVRKRERGVKRALRVGFYALADAVMVYGCRAKALLQEMGLAAARIHVIYNSLDYPTQAALRTELMQTSRSEVRREMLGCVDERVLIFVGRLEASKELDVLLKAVAKLNASGESVRLVCVGDGPMRESMRKLAADLGIEANVVFWGSCYEEAVLARLFYAADLAVSPGPVGLLAVHSLAYGTPIVISDAVDKHGPEFEVVVEGRTGAVFKEGSIDSLSAAIASGLAGLKKPDVSTECVRAVEREYSPRGQAELINAIVRSVVATPLETLS